MSINVSEIFYSIQGETTRTGFPSVFVRLCGCNLDCSFCDTPHAKFNGELMTAESIIDTINKYSSADHVTVTGGEPLIQENSFVLIKRIIDNGNSVQVETNGSIDLSGLPENARKIVDIKTPSSCEVNSFNFENIDLLKSNDEVKFVISDMADYIYSKNFIKQHLLNTEAVINFSPAFNEIPLIEISELILKDRLNVRLNIQLHKIIGMK